MIALRSFLLFVFAFGAIANGFVAPRPLGNFVTTPSTSSTLHMFNTDDGKKEVAPLPTAEPLKSLDEPEVPSVSETANIVKDLNTGELKQVQWKDPAMAANSNPFDMTWWAYALFVFFPFSLLLNDVAKSMGGGFLPTDGPLGFLGGL